VWLRAAGALSSGLTRTSPVGSALTCETALILLATFVPRLDNHQRVLRVREAMMNPNVDCNCKQEAHDSDTATMSSPSTAVHAAEPKAMEYEAWRVLLQSACGRYSPEGVEPKNFVGSIRPLSVWGCAAVDASCNVHRVERTSRDVRLDGAEHYYAVLQLVGRTTMSQNDRVAELAVGDVALVDATRPVTYISENRPARWLSLHLPRQSVISHLGLEPEGGLYECGQTPANRLFSRLIQDAVNEHDPACASAEPYMQLAIYDLLGALFATPDLPAISSHTDKLFKRICSIIKERFADPDLSPGQVATEAGISLRYLQKLFTVRNSSCTHFILSARLEHAARLLHRGALLNTRQPVSQIAYASGFNDPTYFTRQFRRRFGHPPGAHGKDWTARERRRC
jgi:AraC family transcriptional regulator, positive regulator of tynA and feaB